MRLARRHRIVLWDCFWNAIFSFIGCNKVTRETGSEFDPKKQSHSAIRDSKDPVSRTTSKWPIALVVLADSLFVFCKVYVFVSVLFCYVFVVFFIKKLSRVVSFFIQKQRRSNCVVSGLADDMNFLLEENP